MGLFDSLIGDSLLGADQGSALPVSDMDRYKAAISANESDGNYGLTGPVTRTGDRAYGKYQVMGNNVGPWTKEVLGREMTPSEFLSDPQAQERVFEGKFGQLVTKFGNPQDAASAWFSGRPRAQAGNAHDILGTSVPQYVANFNATLGKQPGQSAMTVDTTAAPQPLGAPDPSQLVLPSERYRNLAQAMTQAGLTRPVHGLGDALLGFSNMLQGNAYGSQYEQQQKAYNSAFGNMLAGVKSPDEAINLAAKSQNPAYMLPALQQKLTRDTWTPTTIQDLMGPRTVMWNQATQQMRELDGTPITNPAALNQAHSAGAQPATPSAAQPLQPNSPQFAANAANAARAAGIDSGTASMFGAGGNPQAAVSAASQPRKYMEFQQAVNAGLKGEDLFQAMPPRYSAYVNRARNVIAGKDVPTERDKDFKPVMQLVYAADPTFPRTDLQARKRFREEFMNANSWTGKMASAINNSAQHGGDLAGILPNIPDHSGTGPLNAARNWLDAKERANENDPNLNRAQVFAHALGNEMVKLQTGAEGDQSARETSYQHYAPQWGATHAAAALGATADLMHSREQDLRSRWQAGSTGLAFPEQLISPQARAFMAKYSHDYRQAHGIPEPTPSASNTPAVPQTNPFGVQGAAGKLPSGIPRQILEGPGGHRIGDYGTGQWIDMETGQPFRAPK